MIDVRDDLLEHVDDVVVVELVDDLAPLPVADDEPEVAHIRSWCETADPPISTAR